MANWYLLRINTKFAWGFSVKTPTTSAAEISLLYPPPSTLIGALAKGFSYLTKNWTECITDEGIVKSSSVKLLDFIVSAHFGFFTNKRGIVPWNDILRSYAVPYQQIQHRSKRQMWFGVHASGKVYAPNFSAGLVYVVNGLKAKKYLGREFIAILKKCGYCITALGGKEGLTTVQNVKIFQAKIIEDNENLILTSYYCPETAIKSYMPRELKKEEYWDYRKSSPHWSSARVKNVQTARLSYILPIDRRNLFPRPIKVYLSDSGIALSGNDIEKTTVILLKEWLSDDRD